MNVMEQTFDSENFVAKVHMIINSLHCMIGTLGPVSARWLGSAGASCTMPARAAGRAALGLGVNGQWHSEGGGATYSYEAAPTALNEAREADGAAAGAAGAPAAAAEGADTSVAAV